MRWTALLVVVCVLLSGCISPFAGGEGDGGTGATPTAETSTPVVHEERADPESDRLGWEAGYWHDDPVDVTPENGLNESEREAVVGRAMARVETVRNMEFEKRVNVTVVSRANYSLGDNTSHGEAFETFDNAKFEALYLIGNQEDSLATQEETRNQTVAGYYSPDREAIVLVSDSETPQLDSERTLAHELVHALQDQQFDLTTTGGPETRDAYNGRNGLIEGDARAVEQTYMGQCGENWSCVATDDSGQAGNGSSGGGTDIHLGVYILSYFPYSDGPGLVSYLRDGGDWESVNDAFDDPPSSSTAVINPERYGSFEPTNVSLRDRTRNGWERVRPEERKDYAVLGQSALTAMFAYTLYDDYNESTVVEPDEFLNREGISVNRTDPFNYGLEATQGWEGDRMHVYERDGESGYVWRLVWDSPTEAEQFADEYRALLGHWNGESVADGVWSIPDDSPFAGAVSLDVDGDTVTIVHAPERDALGDVYRGAG